MPGPISLKPAAQSRTRRRRQETEVCDQLSHVHFVHIPQARLFGFWASWQSSCHDAGQKPESRTLFKLILS